MGINRPVARATATKNVKNKEMHTGIIILHLGKDFAVTEGRKKNYTNEL